LASTIGNIAKLPELRRRLLFTLVCLAVYRIGVFVTTPGVNRLEMKNIISTGGSGSFLGLFNMFSGGALEKLSIFALGIMPYVSASIILQLLTVVIPTLDRLSKEGEQGRKKINQYTRYGCVILALIQSFFIASWLESLGRGGFSGGGGSVVVDPGWTFRILTMVSLTTGTAFIMWLGEQITERGIGNGISLIIFAGIVCDIPDAIMRFWSVKKMGDIGSFQVIFLVGLIVFVIAAITFFERGHRRIPIQYAKRMVGRKMYGGQSTFLPLKINSAGVIPPIFASSILLFPAQIANMANSTWLHSISQALQPGDWRYDVVFVFLIIFFSYFYTAVTFNPVDVADNMKKNGGFIPGIRPGKKTAEYIDRVLTRITFAGALYISIVCMLPSLLSTKMKIPFQFGGTGLLIVVGVALDFVQQVESHLISHQYEGFGGPKGPRIRGRTGAALSGRAAAQ
jgi:preprotein translocase subunit SecY